jgi:hypothetical protein
MSLKFYAKRSWNLKARHQRNPAAGFSRKPVIRLADFVSGKTEKDAASIILSAARNFRFFHPVEKGTSEGCDC